MGTGQSGVRKILAAGAVVTRDVGGRREILLVHRPRYQDWSLPKGKLEPGETLPAAAVRETAEETGVEIRLGAALPLVRYLKRGTPKEVSYWIARALRETTLEPTAEIDGTAWLPAQEARARLSYEVDVATVDAALARPAATTLVIVRHASATERSAWPTDDRSRPLRAEGRAEVDRLEALLAPWDIGRIITSPALRCVETVQPFASRRGMTVSTADELTEEVAEHEPAAVVDHLSKLLVRGPGTLICTHRPLLAPIADALGIELSERDRREPLPPAGMWVVHVPIEAESTGPGASLVATRPDVEMYHP